MPTKLKSRKLWAMVGGAVLTALNAGLGNIIPQEAMNWIMGLIATYLAAQGAVDVTQVIMETPTKAKG